MPITGFSVPGSAERTNHGAARPAHGPERRHRDGDPTLTYVPTRSADDIVAVFHELQACPRRALHLGDIEAREALLTTARELLDQMRRISTGERDEQRRAHLEALWQQERRRIDTALHQPVIALSSLGPLEEQWLRANPGHELDLRPNLVLVIDHLENWLLRGATAGFLVRSGLLQHSLELRQYDLLIAPEWFAAQLPVMTDGGRLGLTGPEGALRTKITLDGVDDDLIETIVALWSDDVTAELFQLPAVVAAAHALRQLEHADTTRS